MNRMAVARELVKIAKELMAVGKKPDVRIKRRLEYLRKEIEAERISYGEISELQSLVDYIDPGDVQLLEWAGVPEKRHR